MYQCESPGVPSLDRSVGMAVDVGVSKYPSKRLGRPLSPFFLLPSLPQAHFHFYFSNKSSFTVLPHPVSSLFFHMLHYIQRIVSRRSPIGLCPFPQPAQCLQLRAQSQLRRTLSLSSIQTHQRQWSKRSLLLLQLQQRNHYSAAAISQNEKARSNLNLIDFFDPDLATSTPHSYTLKYGVSGHAKAGKVLATDDDWNQGPGIYTSVQVGDDAYFVRSDSLGVSDGVGGKLCG